MKPSDANVALKVTGSDVTGHQGETSVSGGQRHTPVTESKDSSYKRVILC